MKQAALFLIFLACCAFICVHSKSIYQLNEEEETIPDLLNFQSQNELESHEIERRRNSEQSRNWDDHRDNSISQSCVGLHGSWFC